MLVEPLEDRTLPALVNWINPLGGSWDTGANWSTGAAPGSADDVVIAQSGINLTHAVTVKSLALSGGTLNGAGGGDLTVSTGLSVTGFVTLNQFTLENQGVATLTSVGGNSPTIYLQNAASIVNKSGALWDMQTEVFLEAIDTTSNPASANSFINAGTVQKTATTGTAHMRVPFTNSNAVSIQAGTFSLAGGGASTGSFNVVGGTTLSVDAGTYAFNAGTSFAVGAGGIGIAGVAVTGGTADFSTGSPITIDSLTETGGTLTGSDTIHITGATTWTGGAMAGAGTTSADGTLTLGTNLLLNRTLAYTGPTPWTMPSAHLFQGSGTFTFSTGATSTTPGLSATMTVTLVDDVNGDTQADPGDTIQYTVTITNNGSTTAQNLVFSDTLDPNTTLIPESVSYPAVATTLITDADVAGIVAAAKARWQAAGISTGQLAILNKATFTLADLDGLKIAQAVGTRVFIDLLAGRQGWFVDPTPSDDSEFTVSGTHGTANVSTAALGRLDLLTAVMRAMGAQMGISAADAPDLMTGMLLPGIRNLPTPASALAATGNTLAQLHLAYGFHDLIPSLFNVFKANEKWFQDRTGSYYGLLPSGQLIRYTGGASYTASGLPNLGVLVYDDPLLLFNAQMSIDSSVVSQMSTLRSQNGFHDLIPSLFNVFKANEKWFQDRNGTYYGLLPSGQLIRYDGGTTYVTAGLPNFGPLVYDDPTQLFNAPVTIPQATIDQMSSYRVTYGFHDIVASLFNVFKAREKWFQDRNGTYYGLLPSGQLIRYDGGATYVSAGLPNFSPLVYDDPSQLFKAPAPLSAGVVEQLSQLRIAYGFYDIGTAINNAFKANEKWFKDRNGNYYALLTNGDLIKFDGVGFTTSKQRPIANLGALVYDDPSQLWNAPVTSSASVIDQMETQRELHGFHDVVPALFNVFKHNEKWFTDRNGSYYGLLPSGQLIQYDGASFYITTGLPLLDPLVYDDPTRLFTTPLTLSSDTIVQMVQLRSARGFHDIVPALNNVFKTNEKWFTDRNGSYFGLLPSGQLVQYDGASFYITTGLPLLDPLVYDDPTLLFKATTETDTVIPPLGSLAAGQSLVITFEASINATLPAGVKTVVNQAAINGTDVGTGTAYATVLTDDPAKPGATDPTSIAVVPTDVFDDPDLEAAVQSVLGLAANHTVTKAELLNLTNLSVDSNKISTLAGLQYATNLQTLSLLPGDWSIQGSLPDLTPLANLTKLKSLALVRAGITDSQLSALSNLPALQTLDLRYNAITNTSFVAGAASLPALASLQLYGNSIADLSGIAGKFINVDLEPTGADQAQTVSALAQALYKSPIEIYQYVTNHVENQFYSGLLKGEQATLETQAGNDWDQANLLAKLLQQAGLMTRFVSGTIQAPIATVEAWLGVTNLLGTGALLATAGLHPSFNASQTLVSFDHTWLEVQSGASWIDLDASWKFRDFQPGYPGIAAIPFDSAGYSAQSQQTAAEYYVTYISQILSANVPGTSIADVSYTGPIHQQTFSALPAALPYTVVGAPTTSATVPASQQTTVQVTLKQGSTTLFGPYTLTTSADSLKRVVVEYTDAGGGLLTPKLMVDGIAVAVGANVTSGAAVAVTLLQKEPGSAGQTITYNSTAGKFLAMGIDALQVSDRLLERQQDAINAAAVAHANSTAIDPDQQVGAVLALAMFRWIDQVDKGEAAVADITQAVPVYAGNLRSGIAASSTTVGYYPDLQISAVPGNVSIFIPTYTDAQNVVHSYFHQDVDVTGDNIYNSQRNQIIDLNGTDQTNAVLQALLNSPASGGAVTGSPAAVTLVPFNADTTQTIVGSVNVASGNVVRTETDIQIPGIGMPLTFARHYNSLDTVDHGMGIGWSFSYGDRLAINGDGSRGWTDDQGALHTFTPDGGGGYNTPSTLYGTLTFSAGVYTYTDVHGLVHQFDSTGKLTSIADHNGNGVSIAYDGSGHITTVTEANAAHQLTFTYTGSHITGISDGTGRTWTYTYVGSQLTRATDPTTAFTAYAYRASTELGAGQFSQVTEANGAVTTYSYYANRRAYQVNDAAGDMQTFSYNLYRSQTSYIDEHGNTSIYAYDPAGHITRLTHPDNTSDSFIWSGNLKTSATDVFGLSELYVYDPIYGNLLQTTDRAGSLTTMTFDTAHFSQVVSVTLPGGAATSYGYDGNFNLAQINDALGHIASITTDVHGQLVSKTFAGNTTNYTYSTDGQVLTRTTGPSTDTYTYDSRGRVSTWKDANNHTTTYTYDLLHLTKATDATSHDTIYVYDAVGNRTAMTDALGRTTTFVYDLMRHLIKTINPDGTILSALFDTLGNPIVKIDELGRATTSVFDDRNRQVQTIYADGSSSRTRYDGGGRITASTDPNGNTTQFGYDVLGHQLTSVNAFGPASSRTYDAAGNMLTSTDALSRSATVTITNASPAVVTWTAHGFTAGMAVRFSTTGDLPTGITAGTTYYVIAGGLTANTFEISTTIGGAAVNTSSAGSGTHTGLWTRTTQYQYDQLNRLTAVTDPLGNTTHYTYDFNGNLATVVNPLGATTTYAYDAFGRLTTTTDALGKSTVRTYDPAGNLTSITDPVGNVSNFGYDALNRVISQSNPAGGPAQTYAYDLVGNRTAMTDFNGRVIHYTYDVRNRDTLEEWMNGAAVTRAIHYSYDGAAEMTFASDPDSSYAFAYDQLGRQVVVDNKGTLGVPSVAIIYGYDAAGNVLNVRDLYSGSLKDDAINLYDALNRVTRINTNTLTYDAAGQLTALSAYSNAALTAQVVTGAYTYDAAGQLTALKYTKGAATTAQYGWAFDAAGRIITQTGSAGTLNYGYDADNQLTSASGEAGFAYDDNGNRTTGTTIGAGNRLFSDGTYTYVYDGAGNPTSQSQFAGGTSVVEYSWDYRNRLTRVVFKNSAGGAVVKQVDYTYDVFNHRIGKSVDPDGAGAQAATVDRYVYNGNQVTLQFNSAGALTHHYVYGPAGQILTDTNAGGTTTWALTDQLGSVRDLVNSAGTVIDHITYSSFGKVLTESAPATSFLFGFAGNAVERESGLQYDMGRYYNPSTGRYISQHPLSFGGGDANLYRYAGNNPVSATDPSGLKKLALVDPFDDDYDPFA